MSFIYNYFSRFLLVLFPFSFVTGVFLPNLIVFILILKSKYSIWKHIDILWEENLRKNVKEDLRDWED